MGCNDADVVISARPWEKMPVYIAFLCISFFPFSTAISEFSLDIAVLGSIGIFHE
jgi:hypothetical protein